jgi:NADH-quinone oxidoreductase E subunit
MADLHPTSAYAPERFADPDTKVQFSAEALKRVEELLPRYPNKQAALLPVLHIAQEQFGWISPETMLYVGELLDLPPAYVYGVVSFYHMYNLKPVGKYHLQVCTNLSCMLNGAYDIYDMLSQKLHCAPYEISADGRFTYSEVECLGSCDTAPVVQVNNDYHENTSVQQMEQLLDRLK